MRDRAAAWLASQIMAHESCIARLRSVQNNAVNLEAQRIEIDRMQCDVDVWRYLERLIPS